MTDLAPSIQGKFIVSAEDPGPVGCDHRKTQRRVACCVDGTAEQAIRRFESQSVSWVWLSISRIRAKAWTTRGGKHHVARPFSRMTLRLLLSNVLYTGMVNHKGTVYPGEHEGVVEQELWEKVNVKLTQRSIHLRGKKHQKQEASLSGLLYCAGCGSAMLPSFTTKKGRRYRYYGCPANRGREVPTCPQGSVAALDLEASLLDKLGPVLGTGLNWGTIRDSIHRIEYEWLRHRVVIGLKDGKRMEYEMRTPNRAKTNADEKEIDVGRVPRVSRLMALAIKFERLVREGEIRNHRTIAETGQISRARMSQIMRLTDLAPSIQEELLFLPKILAGRDPITEKGLRQIASSVHWDRQKSQFEDLKASRKATGAHFRS